MRLDLAARSDSGLVRRRSADWGVVNPRMRLGVVAEAGSGSNTDAGVAQHVASAVVDAYGRARATSTREGRDEAAEHLRLAMAYGRPGEGAAVPQARDVASLGAAAFAAGFIVVARLGAARCFRLRGRALQRMPFDGPLAETAPMDGPTPPGGDTGLELQTCEYRPGDVYLLCTGGLWGAVGDESLVSVLALDESADFICDRLVRTAWRAGGLDSLAVAVARLT